MPRNENLSSDIKMSTFNTDEGGFADFDWHDYAGNKGGTVTAKSATSGSVKLPKADGEGFDAYAIMVSDGVMEIVRYDYSTTRVKFCTVDDSDVIDRVRLKASQMSGSV